MLIGKNFYWCKVCGITLVGDKTIVDKWGNHRCPNCRRKMVLMPSLIGLPEHIYFRLLERDSDEFSKEDVLQILRDWFENNHERINDGDVLTKVYETYFNEDEIKDDDGNVILKRISDDRWKIISRKKLKEHADSLRKALY